MLSGRGYVRKYSNRMGKTPPPYYLYEELITQSTMFSYVHADRATAMTSIIGMITATNIVGIMITSQAKAWVRIPGQSSTNEI